MKTVVPLVISDQNKDWRQEMNPLDPRPTDYGSGAICPGCGRIMSVREAAEQGECNDCHPGGAWSPDGYYGFDEPRL